MRGLRSARAPGLPLPRHTSPCVSEARRPRRRRHTPCLCGPGPDAGPPGTRAPGPGWAARAPTVPDSDVDAGLCPNACSHTDPDVDPDGDSDINSIIISDIDSDTDSDIHSEVSQGRHTAVGAFPARPRRLYLIVTIHKAQLAETAFRRSPCDHYSHLRVVSLRGRDGLRLRSHARALIHPPPSLFLCLSVCSSVRLSPSAPLSQCA